MNIDITPIEREVFQLISASAQELGMNAYAIGGFVRDKILERPIIDIDIVCDGNGIELANRVASKIKPTPHVAVFKRFGTAMFKFKNKEIEFVGARKESYSKDSRNPIVEAGTIEEDQRRRDFTINAMAIKLEEGGDTKLIDPFNGIADLENKILKTPLEPGVTFFDDPLRMMRAIRFATQLGFEIEAKTFSAIAENKERIKIIVQERITTELNKIVLSAKPSIGFKLLDESGLLELIFPRMSKLKGIEIRDGKGHKDNFYHTIEVLDNLSENTEDLWLRWAAILHDIAKPPTKRFDKNNGWTFHGHEVMGASWVPKIFKKFKLPLDHKMKYVQKLVRLHLRPISLTKDNITDSAVRRLLFDASDDIDDLMLLCHADITSKNPQKVERYRSNYVMVKQKLEEVEEKDKIRNWQPPIDGELIMKTFSLSPSREVGVIKDAIREAILDGDIPNDFSASFDFMIKEAKKLGLEAASESA